MVLLHGELAMGKNAVAAPKILFRGVIKKFKLKKLIKNELEYIKL